ncbi:hypothetical protein ABIA96_003665 [Bradyrhizobium sp. LB11.1]
MCGSDLSQRVFQRMFDAHARHCHRSDLKNSCHPTGQCRLDVTRALVQMFGQFPRWNESDGVRLNPGSVAWSCLCVNLGGSLPRSRPTSQQSIWSRTILDGWESAWCEADLETADLETVILELMAGEYWRPIRSLPLTRQRAGLETSPGTVVASGQRWPTWADIVNPVGLRLPAKANVDRNSIVPVCRLWKQL